MRVLVIVKGNKDSEAGILPQPEFFAEMGKFNEKLIEAGVILAAEGLQPSSKGRRVQFSGGKTVVTDGPFAESKELVAGFWLWKVGSLDEAVDWLKRSPFKDGAELEIRQIYEADDLGIRFTPELREQEQRLRRIAEGRK